MEDFKASNIRNKYLKQSPVTSKNFIKLDNCSTDTTWQQGMQPVAIFQTPTDTVS